MTTVRDTKTSRIKKWWQQVNQNLELFFTVMVESHPIAPNDECAALTYLENRSGYVRQLDTPDELNDIRDQLLQAIQHLHQSVTYQHSGDDLMAKSRYQMAKSSLDNVRWRLLQFQIVI